VAPRCVRVSTEFTESLVPEVDDGAARVEVETRGDESADGARTGSEPHAAAARANTATK
jgi:hypothetical protein